MAETVSFLEKGTSSKPIWEERVIDGFLHNSKWGLPGTDGTKWSNFKAYAMQHHQLLSCFSAHRLHPYTQNERLTVMFCSFAFTFMVTVVEKVGVRDAELVCDEGCPMEQQYWQGFCGGDECEWYTVPVSEYTEGFNSVANGLGVICGSMVCGNNPIDDEFLDLDCNGFESSMDSNSENLCDHRKCYFHTQENVDTACSRANVDSTIMILGIFVFIYDQALKSCAECGCVQNKNALLECCAECIGSMVLGGFFCLSIIFWMVGLVWALSGDNALGTEFIFEWVLVKCQGWVYSLFFSIIIFYFTHGKAKKKYNERYPGLTCLPDNVTQAKESDKTLGITSTGNGGGVHHTNVVDKGKAAVKDLLGVGSAQIAPEPQAQQVAGGGQRVMVQQANGAAVMGEAVDLNGDGRADVIVGVGQGMAVKAQYQQQQYNQQMQQVQQQMAMQQQMAQQQQMQQQQMMAAQAQQRLMAAQAQGMQMGTQAIGQEGAMMGQMLMPNVQMTMKNQQMAMQQQQNQQIAMQQQQQQQQMVMQQHQIIAQIQQQQQQQQQMTPAQMDLHR